MDSQRLLDTFLDLVQIDSPSGKEGAVADYCADVLSKIGCTVSRDGSASKTGSDTGNLIAELPGDRPGKIFITAHMDNVEPCHGIKPLVDGDNIKTDGSTVLGGDDKVGIAAAIECLRTIIDTGASHPTLCVLLTVQEECGLVGAKNLDEGIFDGECALVCDGDDAPGTVTVSSAWHYRFDYEFIGRSAHAGICPEKGISAIEMAASAVSAMELGRIDEETVGNVASISGGGPSNVVCDRCSIMGECRSLSERRLEEVRSQIEEAVAMTVEAYGGKAEGKWERTVEGYSLDTDGPLMDLVASAASDAGLPFGTVSSLGSTDGNFFVLKGARPIVMGTGMSDVHTTREHISMKDARDLVSHLVGICTSYSGE